MKSGRWRETVERESEGREETRNAGVGAAQRPGGASGGLVVNVQVVLVVPEGILVMGWHYLSNATCLIRPHLLYACFVVSRIISCYIIRHF